MARAFSSILTSTKCFRLVLAAVQRRLGGPDGRVVLPGQDLGLGEQSVEPLAKLVEHLVAHGQGQAVGPLDEPLDGAGDGLVHLAQGLLVGAVVAGGQGRAELLADVLDERGVGLPVVVEVV